MDMSLKNSSSKKKIPGDGTILSLSGGKLEKKIMPGRRQQRHSTEIGGEYHRWWVVRNAMGFETNEHIAGLLLDGFHALLQQVVLMCGGEAYDSNRHGAPRDVSCQFGEEECELSSSSSGPQSVPTSMNEECDDFWEYKNAISFYTATLWRMCCQPDSGLKELDKTSQPLQDFMMKLVGFLRSAKGKGYSLNYRKKRPKSAGTSNTASSSLQPMAACSTQPAFPTSLTSVPTMSSYPPFSNPVFVPTPQAAGDYSKHNPSQTIGSAPHDMLWPFQLKERDLPKQSSVISQELTQTDYKPIGEQKNKRDDIPKSHNTALPIVTSVATIGYSNSLQFQNDTHSAGDSFLSYKSSTNSNSSFDQGVIASLLRKPLLKEEVQRDITPKISTNTTSTLPSPSTLTSQAVSGVLSNEATTPNYPTADEYNKSEKKPNVMVYCEKNSKGKHFIKTEQSVESSNASSNQTSTLPQQQHPAVMYPTTLTPAPGYSTPVLFYPAQTVPSQDGSLASLSSLVQNIVYDSHCSIVKPLSVGSSTNSSCIPSLNVPITSHVNTMTNQISPLHALNNPRKILPTYPLNITNATSIQRPAIGPFYISPSGIGALNVSKASIPVPIMNPLITSAVMKPPNPVAYTGTVASSTAKAETFPNPESSRKIHENIETALKIKQNSTKQIEKNPSNDSEAKPESVAQCQTDDADFFAEFPTSKTYSENQDFPDRTEKTVEKNQLPILKKEVVLLEYDKSRTTKFDTNVYEGSSQTATSESKMSNPSVVSRAGSNRSRRERQLICTICQLIFDSGTDLLVHRYEYHSHVCGECDCRFLSLSRLRQHKAMDHPSLLLCTNCRFHTFCRKTLLQHAWNEHQVKLPEKDETENKSKTSKKKVHTDNKGLFYTAKIAQDSNTSTSVPSATNTSVEKFSEDNYHCGSTDLEKSFPLQDNIHKLYNPENYIKSKIYDTKNKTEHVLSNIGNYQIGDGIRDAQSNKIHPSFEADLSASKNREFHEVNANGDMKNIAAPPTTEASEMRYKSKGVETFSRRTLSPDSPSNFELKKPRCLSPNSTSAYPAREDFTNTQCTLNYSSPINMNMSSTYSTESHAQSKFTPSLSNENLHSETDEPKLVIDINNKEEEEARESEKPLCLVIHSRNSKPSEEACDLSLKAESEQKEKLVMKISLKQGADNAFSSRKRKKASPKSKKKYMKCSRGNSQMKISSHDAEKFSALVKESACITRSALLKASDSNPTADLTEQMKHKPKRATRSLSKEANDSGFKDLDLNESLNTSIDPKSSESRNDLVLPMTPIVDKTGGNTSDIPPSKILNDVSSDHIYSPANNKVLETTDSITPKNTSVPNPNKRHTCPIEGCNASFSRKWSMEGHVARNHEGLVHLTCEELKCGKSFPNKRSLRQHINLEHDGKERKYHCMWADCNKSFFAQTHLRVHTLTHTGEKPLACKVCDYRCRQRNALTWHMKKNGCDQKIALLSTEESKQEDSSGFQM